MSADVTHGLERQVLQSYLDALLSAHAVKDYCPNGLQVEGRGQIRRVVCGVTASQALIDQAIAMQADALIVHHGYFWKGEPAALVGVRRRRIASLLAHDINLFAYHLPLDLHAELGNNVQLARLMGWPVNGQCGELGLVFWGDFPEPVAAGSIVQQLSAYLGREALLIATPDHSVRRLAWCTGGAQSYFQAAIDQGADMFVSGEISEPSVHLAREAKVAYVAAGHHATERYGIKALGEHLAERFGVEVHFVDVDNPV